MHNRQPSAANHHAMHQPTTLPADSGGLWQLAADANVRVDQEDGATCTVTRGALSVVLPAESGPTAAWLTTPRTLAQLLAHAGQQEPPIPPLAVVRTLLRLANGRLLADPPAGWGLPLPGTGLVGPLLRNLPPMVWLRYAQVQTVAALVWLLLWLGLPSLLPLPYGLDGTEVAVMTESLLLALFLWRALARGFAAQAVGLPGAAQSLRLRWQSGTELGRVAMTASERQRAQVVAWSGLSALAMALLFGVGAMAFSQQPLLRLAVWICALALLVDSSPALPSDARTLLGVATTTPMLGGRARAWLVRRSAQNLLRQKPMSDLEKRYAWAATLGMLHVLFAWWLTTRRLLPWALALVHGGIRHGNALWAGVPMALAVLWLAVLLAGLASIVWDLLRQWRPRLSGAKMPPSSTDHRALLVAAAHNVPFLREMGEDVLERLPLQMEREAWRSGEAILRQGDAGDRFCCLAEGCAVVEWEDEAGIRHPLARLRPGDFFGESAVFEATPRTAYVIADGPVEVYTLSREVCRTLVQNSGTQGAEIRRQLRHAAALREHPLFAGLGAAELAAAVEQTQSEWRAPGEVVLEAGEPGSDVYVVLSGTCGVWQNDVQTATLGPRDWFGELALLTGAPRNATVRAITAAELLRVPSAATDGALAHDPASAFRLWQVAVQRLSTARGAL